MPVSLAGPHRRAGDRGAPAGRAPIELLDDGGANLAAYLEGADLPAPVRVQAQAVIAARTAYADLEQQRAALDDLLDETRRRAEQLQDSLSDTSDLRGAGAAALRKR